MRIVLLFLFSLCSLPVFTQNNPILWCHELNNSEGLTAQDFNYHVYCDSDDFVWISSTKGLNRFNGRSIKQYLSDFQDSTALYGQNIQSNFFEDGNTNIWFCTYEAIHRYNRQKDEFDHYFIKDEGGKKFDEDYKLFYLERDSFLWVKVAKNIFRINIAEEKEIEQSFEGLSPVVSTEHYHVNIGASKTGNLKYIFSSTGTRKKGMEVFEIKNGEVSTTFNKDIFKSFSTTPSVFQTYFDADQTAWITTNQGLFRWDFKNGNKDYLLPEVNTTAFIQSYDKDHLIISARHLGLFLYNKKRNQLQKYDLRKIGAPQSSYDNNIRNIVLDKNKVLWITRPDNGLLYSHFEKSKFNSIIYEETGDYLTLTQYENKVLAVSEKNIKILNTSGEEIAKIKTGGLSYIYHSLLISKERILLASRKGIYLCDMKQNTFDLIPNTENKDFLYLYQLNNNKIIASSQFQGIFEIGDKDGNWEVRNIYKPNEDFVGYTTIYQDGLSQIYICENETNVRVFQYNKDKLTPKDNLSIRGSIFCFYEEVNKNTLWIGTSYGLVKLNKTDFDSPKVVYTHSDGLPDNNVLNIIPSPSDELWLSTSKGLTLMDKQQQTFKNFSLADGMLSNQFKNYSGLKLNNGTIWFGGNNGITVIPPKSIKSIETIPKVIFTDIKIDDVVPDYIACELSKAENINEISRLQYTYKENTLSFNFLATDYSDPFSTSLSYMLEGFDKKWVHINKGETGFARYGNLPSGNYVFKIKGTNSDDEEERSILRSMEIIITPPLWERTWFRILAGTILTLIIIFFILRRIKVVQEKAQLKTRIVENKMSALAAQMSPHFIFNSLQSINRFILKQNRQQASEYLGRFSLLIRMMLENSRNSEHSIEEEVEFLQLYMKVEKQRFKTPFDSSITIDKKIGKSVTYIPTMILQPFIENAIWHGISHKSGEGKITVDIDKQNDLLKCTIEDDGVGRAKAKELSVSKSHKSRALEIMEERLALLFPEQKHLCKIVYIDLEDANTNEPCGTRVIISLPIKE